MITVVQRVAGAGVRVGGDVVARIGPGLLLLVGVERGDGDADALATGRKVAALRVFPGRTPMDRTVADAGGACLVVSQFTLAASIRKGNRPSFDGAEDPALAERLYLRVAAALQEAGLPVETGVFGATMEVDLRNDGPVTFLVVVRGGRVAEVSPAAP
jgi:D-tyrosyl-tRNA(Tyr) deacylase